MEKLASRKLWVSVAAALASIGASIAGLATDNEVIATVGIACTVLSAAIYAACEAYVDGKSVASTTTTIQASTTSKDVVAALTGAVSETREAGNDQNQ